MRRRVLYVSFIAFVALMVLVFTACDDESGSAGSGTAFAKAESVLVSMPAPPGERDAVILYFYGDGTVKKEVIEQSEQFGTWKVEDSELKIEIAGKTETLTGEEDSDELTVAGEENIITFKKCTAGIDGSFAGVWEYRSDDIVLTACFFEDRTIYGIFAMKIGEDYSYTYQEGEWASAGSHLSFEITEGGGEPELYNFNWEVSGDSLTLKDIVTPEKILVLTRKK